MSPDELVRIKAGREEGLLTGDEIRNTVHVRCCEGRFLRSRQEADSRAPA